ncbi:MAG TPA: hypothetical protein PLL75_01770, partial [Candidatus Omnitrophota bacterium]|nr:hypothetical protein [Candidatus Omnitrophota bacterium]HPS36442.1 hypothetical protein [Candidatus Omnitrophota bacterium]
MDERFVQPWECWQAWDSAPGLRFSSVVPRFAVNRPGTRKALALFLVVVFTLFSILPPQAYAEVITLDGGTIDIQKQD